MLIDVAVHAVIAVSFALAGAKLHAQENSVTSTGLWALLMFEAVLVAPLMVCLCARNPEWFFLYLVELDGFHWVQGLSQAVVAGLSVAAYLGARKLLLRGGWFTGPVLWLGAVLLAGLLVLIGWSRASMVGRTSELVADTPMRPLFETSEGYLLLGSLVALGFGTAITSWRLFLYARAMPVRTRFTGAVPVRDGNTKALPRGDDAPITGKGSARAN